MTAVIAGIAGAVVGFILGIWLGGKHCTHVAQDGVSTRCCWCGEDGKETEHGEYAG